MGILVLLLIIAAVAFVNINNKLVRLKNAVRNSFSTVDVYLKQRYDMIPNLVEAVKGYMKYERETLEAIISLRNEVVNGDWKTTVKKDGAVSQKLDRILALSEDYPDLKANEQFTNLYKAIRETENNIAAGRRAYNASVTDYNDYAEVFPSCIVAKITRRDSLPWFEAAEKERANVSIDL